MAIVGVTHAKDGQALIRRSVMTKVAIGRGPDENQNHPSKLDHFVFLKKAQDGGEVEWIDDDEKIKHYGKDCREITIVLLDDDIDQVFRTEYALWATTGKKCHGDGEEATREDKPYGPCANSGKCPEYESGECKPSADLYFMLADYPSLGTVCRLHTSSYQSIRELYSALTDLHSMMGGRLFGLPVKLFVRPEKNVYTGNDGKKKTGVKFILGLELRAESLPGMLESVTGSAKVFADLKKAMGGRKLEIIEDDTERAPEIAREFVTIEPASDVPRAQLPPATPTDPNLSKFHSMADQKKLTQAQRHMLLGRHEGNLQAAMGELVLSGAAAPEQTTETPARTPSDKPRKGGRKAQTSTPAPTPAVVPAPAGPKFGF